MPTRREKKCLEIVIKLKSTAVWDTNFKDNWESPIAVAGFCLPTHIADDEQV